MTTKDSDIEPEQLDDIVLCELCSADIDKADMLVTEDDYSVCSDCTQLCESCECLYSSNESFNSVAGSLYWCDSCVENFAYWCDRCQEYDTNHTTRINDIGEYYCESCTCDWAIYCEDCDEYNSDDCRRCSSRVIHDYSYKPDPIFHSTGTEDNPRLFFGIEVEMETPNGDYDTRTECAEYAHRVEDYNLAYLKGDGSLNCGFELVTHPMTYDFYRHGAEELWKTIEVLRSDFAMKSWSTGTCGLHIHISRSGFNGGAHMHRFLKLIYSNKLFFEHMAGRASDRWATFEDVIGSDGKTRYTFKINRGAHTNRYTAVNTTNRNTIEVRIFRGTTKGSTIMSQISLMHAAVEYTRVMSVQEVVDHALDIDGFMRYIESNAEKYPALVERMVRLTPKWETLRATSV